MRDILIDLNDMLSDPDPVRRAQIQMKKPVHKRFYKDVTTAEGENGVAILLDGKPLKTPARNNLVVPTRALALLVAKEWDDQRDVIDPAAMPITRLVNTAIDAIASNPEPVHLDIVKFAGTDHLCYRADAPQSLVERQSQLWDPIVQWAASEFGARFVLAEGVIHQAQPEAAISAFSERLAAFRSAIELASLHMLTSITGSALLALAFAEGRITAEEAWTLAHVDEDWNIEHWGEDDEAAARRQNRLKDFNAACMAFKAVRNEI